MTQEKKVHDMEKFSRYKDTRKLPPSGICIRLGAMAVTVIIIILSLTAAGWLFGVSLSTLAGIYIGWRLLKLVFRVAGLLLRIVLAIIGILILIGLLALVA
jgi:hypothetical protein